MATSRRSRTAVVVASTNAALFAVLALTQWIVWGGVDALSTYALDGGFVAVDALVVVVANVGFSIVLLAAFFALRPVPRRWAGRIALAAVVAAVLGVPRVWLLRDVPAPVHRWEYEVIDWAAGVAGGVAVLAGALLVHDLIGDVRREEARRRQHVVDAARALSRLEAEEAATRRDIADRLHGRVQNRLVLVAVGLEHTATQLERVAPDAAADLHRWAGVLDELREHEVRALSHDLFPVGADINVAVAVGVLLDRLPPCVSSTLEVGPGLRGLLDRLSGAAPSPEQLVVVYTIEEGLTNALKHGGATRVEVRLDAEPGGHPTGSGGWTFAATVTDDGRGLDGEHRPFHGLARHAARITARGGVLTLRPGARRGTVLELRLPFEEPCPGGADPTPAGVTASVRPA